MDNPEWLLNRLVGGVFGLLALWNFAARSAPADVDPSFNANCSNWVRAVQIQSNGQILAGGYFTNMNGLSGAGVVRFGPDGSLDNSFVVDTGTNSVLCIAVQPDNKIVIGGNFTSVNGTTRTGIARLNPDGSLDTDFNPLLGPKVSLNNQLPSVNSVTFQTNGAMLVAGNFLSVNGTNSTNFARLNSDGSLDSGFAAAVSDTTGKIECTALQTDGRVIIGGEFNSVDGIACTNLVRLNGDGTVDTNFNLTLGLGRDVASVTLQPDGKIVVGGGLVDSFAGTYHFALGRLDTNGDFDASFNPGSGPDGSVNCIAVQPDGRIVIGGTFGSVNGVSRPRIARLNSDGGLDGTFSPSGGLSGVSFNPNASAVALQTDGKIVVGGNFVTVNGISQKYITRFLGNDSPQFTALMPLPNGAVELAGRAATNAHLCLQTSTNLSDWSVVGQFTNVAGTFSLTNNPPGPACGYYRIEWLP